MNLINVNVLEIAVNMHHEKVMKFLEKLESGRFQDIHDPDELFWLFHCTPSSNPELSILEMGLDGKGWTAKSGHDMLIQLGGVWETRGKSGHKWNMTMVGDKIKRLKHEALKSILCAKWSGSSPYEAFMREENSWKTIIGRCCSKAHLYQRFGKISVTCCNSKRMTRSVWVEESFGIKEVGGDMTGCSIQRSIKTGIAQQVTYSPCGHISEDLVEFNGLLGIGEMWYDGVRAILGVLDATDKEINAAFMGGNFRKMGIRRIKEWKPEDLLGISGLRDEKLVKELKIGNEKLKKSYMGRLRSKQSKMRVMKEGSLKGIRLNGMRTELPVDYGQQCWFQAWVDHKKVLKALNAEEVISLLLEYGEIPQWKYCREDVEELLCEQVAQLLELNGKRSDSVVELVGRLMSEDMKPKQIILMLGLAMSVSKMVQKVFHF